jgi:sugar/nucleoside kinase (ribokinase family)
MARTQQTALHPIDKIDDAKVNVIFVHGLDGDYLESWRMNENESWRSWIKSSVPNANIWSLEYRVRSTNWGGGSMELRHRAKQVLHILEETLPPDIPIVFVCHSYGGILVKSMIHHTRTTDAKFSPFIERVSGIVFFSTPHLGSTIPAYFAQLDRLLSASGMGALSFFWRRSVAMSELKKNADQIVALAEWYEGNSNYPAVDHAVFAEDMKTYLFHIVDYNSARLPIKDLDTIKWDADHIDICKPQIKSDLRVLKVINFAQSAISKHAARKLPPAEPKQKSETSTIVGSRKAVIVGAVMADIIVTPENDADDNVRDKIGHIEKVVVGGCAFNMFWHLRKRNIECSLFSGFRESSPFAKLVDEAIRKAGGNPGFIKYSDAVPESIFIGERYASKMRKCISSTSIQDIDLDYVLIERELKDASIAVIDLSLSPSQIVAMSKLCKRTNTELLCNGTSDGRIGRLAGLKGERLDVLICTEDEFEALTGSKFGEAVTRTNQEVCRQSFCRKLVVTRGERGFVIFDTLEQGAIHLEAGTDQSSIVSTMGAGDAFTACYAAIAFEDIEIGREFTAEIFHAEVKRCLPDVLQSKYATS